MDAPCKVQRSIHVLEPTQPMCPGFWVYIIKRIFFHILSIAFKQSILRLIKFKSCGASKEILICCLTLQLYQYQPSKITNFLLTVLGIEFSL